MPITAAYIVPHPPLIVPAVGKGEEEKIAKTTAMYEYISTKIADTAPDTIIFITPHTVIYSDYIHISPGIIADGDFGRFGAKEAFYGVMYEKKLVADVTNICRERGISAGNLGGEGEESLDHGFLVPLHFIHKNFQDFRCARVSISDLPFSEHYRLGQALAETCNDFNRNTVIIASGDLSHKLSEDAPYGFSDTGATFDKKILDAIETADFSRLLSFDEEECTSAAECGLRTFIVMAGMLDKKAVKSRLLSYECPFGVGYAIGEFLVTGDDETRTYVQSEVSAHAALAKMAITAYVTEKKVIDVPEDTTYILKDSRAGVFVSIKKDGVLRGCIGTIAPTTESVAHEIIQNAVSACSRDNRFEPMTADELDSITVTVDVLGAPEKASAKFELNPKRYGVIVSSGNRRGLLLPNLEGITDVDTQLAIALEKGGISANEDYQMERFEVVRYE